ARPNFTVLFHVPQDKQVSIVAGKEAIVSSPTGDRLLLNVEPSPQRIRLVSGRAGEEEGECSWVSERVTQVKPSQCIHIDFAGTQSSICTLTLSPNSATK